MTKASNADAIRRAVRDHYASTARTLATGRRSCCDDAQNSCCPATDAALPPGYVAGDVADLPATAAQASLGCGNPLLLADLHPGEVVLDLGSGAGLDVILSARRVGPSGRAYGLDMTDEMLELARANARAAGVTNAEFLRGQIEQIPLPTASVDVVLSNCVINLAADKSAVLAEALRVLVPGGRLAVADMVVLGQPFSQEAREQLTLWASCASGALSVDEYRRMLAAAGFEQIEIEVTHTYGLEDLEAASCCSALPEGLIGPETRIAAAMIRARRPLSACGCGNSLA